MLRELGKDEEALSFLSSAKEMFGKIQCCKMFAMATDEIGMVNRKKKLYQESLKNFQESYAIYEELKDSLGIVRAGQNIGPVSYTHLDVYKRQYFMSSVIVLIGFFHGNGCFQDPVGNRIFE